MIDKAGLHHLDGAHPDLVLKGPRILRAMADEGHPIKFTQGRRTTKEQAKLYAQGRTKPGKIVTWVDGVMTRSKHQAQQDGTHWAVDVCFVLPGGGVTWEGPWDVLGALVRSEGLAWGGDWKHPDRPHIEVKG